MADPWAAFSPQPAPVAAPAATPAAPANDPWAAFSPQPMPLTVHGAPQGATPTANAQPAAVQGQGANRRPLTPLERMVVGLPPNGGEGAPDNNWLAAGVQGALGGAPIIGPAILGGAERLSAFQRSMDQGGTYADQLAQVQAADAARQDQHPIASTVGGMVGAGVALAPVIAAAPLAFGAGPGALTLGKIAAGAGSAAGLGMADAAVRSGGDPASTIIGGLAGGVGGAAGPIIGAGLQRVGQAGADAFAQSRALRNLGVSKAAADVLMRTANVDGTLGGQGAANIRSAGPNAMLADAGPGSQTVLDTAISRGGPGANDAKIAVNQRAAQAEGELHRAMDSSLGTTDGAYTEKTGIRTGSAPARRTAYEDAYAQPIDYSSPQGKAIKATLRRLKPADFARARDMIRRDVEVPLQEPAQPPQWVPDPTGNAPHQGAPERPFAPLAEDTLHERIPRPPMPRPQSLVNVLQQHGIRDTNGDLKSMGLNRFPGLVRREGGLSPDMARQAAAEAGYLGANIDDAMANTTINDLHDALLSHPKYSILDDHAVAEWEAYDAHRAMQNEAGAPASQPAAPPKAPGFLDMLDPHGAPAPKAPPPTVRELDYIKRALDDVAKAGDGKGALGGNTNEGRINANLSRYLRQQLRDAVPEYGHALDTAATAIDAKNAVEFGGSLMSKAMPRDEARDIISNMSAAEIRHARLGVRATISEALANVRRTMTDGNIQARQAMDAVKNLSSDAARYKLQLLFSKPEEQAAHAALVRELTRAEHALELRAAINMNSKSTPRAMADEVIKAHAEPGMVGTIAQGKPYHALQKGIQFITRHTPADMKARQDAIYNELAAAYTQHRGPAAADFLTRLQQAHTTIAAANARALTVPYARGATVAALPLTSAVVKPAYRRPK